jgi:hypothetical protein
MKKAASISYSLVRKRVEVLCMRRYVTEQALAHLPPQTSGFASLHTYLTECHLTVVEKTQLVLPTRSNANLPLVKVH